MGLRLKFLGGAGTVTGSKYLIAHDDTRLLIDCGLFQGLKMLRLRNWAHFPVDPASVSAVLLSHAHLDHSGYIPLLAKNGFRGPVFSTEATRELCEILLTDTGHLQEKDAEFANRHRYSKHRPALPLYTVDDAEKCLRLFKPFAFAHPFDVPGGGRGLFRRAGHILGAATVELDWGGVRLVHSGDLGRFDDPMLPDPERIERTDYLLIESTYGDRLHGTGNPEDVLAGIVNRTVGRGGTVIVPAFAVGRAQHLIFYLADLRRGGRIPKDLPMFLDSPVAIDASDIFVRNPEDHKLTREQCHVFGGAVKYVRTAEESKALTANPAPKIVISASGMATGGRVLHHLERYAPDAKNSIVFAGYQAAGTRGAAMIRGAKTIKMHGRYIPLNAEIHDLDMLSAHADYSETLRWLKGFAAPPRMTYIVHGEPVAADALRHRIEEELGWPAHVAELGEEVALS